MIKLKAPKSKLAGIGPTLVTLLMVGYLGADRIFHDPPGKDLQAYQTRVTDKLQKLPRCVGPWIGEDQELDPSAIQLLHLDTKKDSRDYIERRYSNGNGEAFTLLFVEVADSRDALGHYPPVCYPSQGWTTPNPIGEPIDWSMMDQTVHGKEYQFDRTQVGSNSQIIVDDFLVLANANFCRDMTELEKSAYDRLRWSYGVGQVQFIFGSETDVPRRREIVETFLNLKEMVAIFDAMKLDPDKKA